MIIGNSCEYGLENHDRSKIDTYVVAGEILNDIFGPAYLHYADTPTFLPSTLNVMDYYDAQAVEEANFFLKPVVAAEEMRTALVEWSIANHGMDSVIKSLEAGGYT